MCHEYRWFWVTTKLTRDSSVSVVTRLRGVQLEVYVEEICLHAVRPDEPKGPDCSLSSGHQGLFQRR